MSAINTQSLSIPLKAESSSSSSAGPSKKRKTDKQTEDANGLKKRLPSCDLCRARKVKCAKKEGSSRCEGCLALNQRCEYTYERRKPGPVNRYVRVPMRRGLLLTIISFAKKPSPSRQTSDLVPPLHPPAFAHPYPMDEHRYADSLFAIPHNQPIHTAPLPLPLPTDTSSIFGSHPNPFEDPFSIDSAWTHGVDPIITRQDLPFLPMSPTTLLHPMPGEHESTDGSPADVWPWNMSGWDMPAPNHATSSSGNGWDGRGSASHGVELELLDVKGKAPAKIKPDRGVRHTEEVVEWGTLMRILHAYHAHL